MASLVNLAEKLFQETLSNPRKKPGRGGTHFETELRFSDGFAQKRPKSAQVRSSLELAQERLGGLVAPFITSGQYIYQEAVIGLHRVLAKNSTDLAKMAVDQCFEVNRGIIQRGVVNWDPTIENYGIRRTGEIVLLDIGGLVTAEDFIDSAETEEDGYLQLFFYRSTVMPHGLDETIKRYILQRKVALKLDSGTSIVSEVERQKNTQSPIRVEISPELRGKLISLGVLEL